MNSLSYVTPRINTRGRYDLDNGLPISGKKPYTLYPKYKFDKIEKSKEIVIFVHGMRNTRKGAVMGTNLLRRQLRKIGYKGPVVAFSYDANILEAHKPDRYKKVLKVAYRIAEMNGVYNLTQYIQHLKRTNPSIRIHLVGHSLGCEVIHQAVKGNRTTSVYSIHFFGSPVEWDDLLDMGYGGAALEITNYYNRKDDVIQEGVDNGDLSQPSCLHRITSDTASVKSKKANAKDHRFRSYVTFLRKFP